MSVQILVSTYKDSIHRISALLASIPAEIDVLVVHQNPEGGRYEYDQLFSRRRLEIHPSGDRGLARSRNTAARLATGDILIPTDDDVAFTPTAISDVERAFAARPDAGVISFQALDGVGMPYKEYAAEAHRHTLRTIRRVFSIEIGVRRDAVTGAGLRWDEDFGLNSRYPGGLETAFLKNALDLGISAYYEPRPIVSHSGLSTGHVHTPRSAFFRGAIYAKLYGPMALPVLAGFAAKNSWRSGSLSGAFEYVWWLYRGAVDYLHRHPGAGAGGSRR